MPDDDDPPLLQHAWIMKMIAYGTGPWTVYGRSWSGDLLEVRLSHSSTEALSRVDGLAPLVTIKVSHGQPASRLCLNCTIVDRIGRILDEGGEPAILLCPDGPMPDPAAAPPGDHPSRAGSSHVHGR
ncbi:hypothetical protein [Nonomuraea sp. NPDC050691]|uniref:hypothetical protein n=1 Tax=Nonomuraea sp. NPDC050691 TaxID=3155661 RepID=UPI00340CF0E1